MNPKGHFLAVLSLPAAERADYLAKLADDVRPRVEELLAAHQASGILPAAPPATTDYAGIQTGLVIAGRYTLEQKLGEGGMGDVWVAKQTEPVKRRVALKLIKAGMDSKAVLQRFEQERQALALMDHPNIAKVLDAGMTTDQRPFFVMELVNGLSLTKYCDEAKLTPRQRLELFIPICQAVQHAHHKGIVHRDLKPSNILVTLIDGKPVPKVIDFGVAKATGGKLTDDSLSTQFGAIVGTFEYMAPEQAGYSGQDVDTRADLYSLGVLLYELLTGLRPFDSGRLKKAAIDEVLRILREEEPPSLAARLSTDASLPSMAALRQTEPRRLLALVKGELDWIVRRCLEKDRNRRYETANGLARDLERYLSDEPVEARPASTGYRLRKFLRRHRGPVLAASIVFLALLAGIVGTSWGLAWALEAENKAVRERDEKDKAWTAEREQRERAEKADALNHVDQALAVLRNDQRLGILHLAHLLPKLPSHTKELRQYVTMTILANGQLLRPLVGDGEAWDKLYIAPNGNLLGWKANATDVEEVGLWEPLTGMQLVRFPFDNLGSDIHTSPNGRFAALIDEDDATVLIVDANSGEITQRLKTDFGQIHNVLISNDGRTCLTVAKGPGEFLIWRAGQQKPLRLPLLKAFALSPDGEMCLTVQPGDTVEARSTATGALVRRFSEIPAPAEDVEFSPSGRVACVVSDNRVHWMDVEGWRVDRRADSLASLAGQRVTFRFLADSVLFFNNRLVVKRGGASIAPNIGTSGSVEATATDDVALTDMDELFELATGASLHPREGHRIPLELKRFASGRLVTFDEVMDLETERPVVPSGGVSPEHRRLPNGIMLLRQGDSLILLPPPDQEIEPQALALWAKVVACGELNAVGGCEDWSEAKWDEQRAALARQPRRGDFPFPGAIVHDAAHSVRSRIDEFAGPTPEQTARWLARVPTWRAYDEAFPERLAERLRFQLEAARLSSPRYWRRAYNYGAAWTIALDRSATRTDLEVALRWCEERERAGVFDKEPTRELLLLRLDRPDEALGLMGKRLARMECVVACGLAMAPWPMKRLLCESSFDRPVRAMALMRTGDVQAAKNWLQAAQALKAREAGNKDYAQLLAEAEAQLAPPR